MQAPCMVLRVSPCVAKRYHSVLSGPSCLAVHAHQQVLPGIREPYETLKAIIWLPCELRSSTAPCLYLIRGHGSFTGNQSITLSLKR